MAHHSSSSAGQAGTPCDVPAGSLGAAVADYLTWHALRGSSARHQVDLRRMLSAFAASADGGRPASEVARADCEAFLKPFQERGCRPNTRKAYHRVLDAFFRWLVTEERLAESPMRRVPKPELPREQVQPLTPEELARLLAQPDPGKFVGARDLALMAFLADTGLRVSEALAARFADLDPSLRSVSVAGKGGKGRTVFYGAAVSALLKAYVARRGDVGPADLLFVSSLGEPLWRHSVTKRIRAYGRAAGIAAKRVSARTLRHTFGVSWCVNGGDAFSLQRLLGHSTPQMTARYVNFAAGDLARLHRELSPLDRLQGCPGAPDARRSRRKRMV